MNIGVVGSNGRMGRSLQSVGAELGVDLVLAASLDQLEALSSVDCIIDFSSREGCLASLALATRERIPFVTGTTGLTEADQERVFASASEIPIVQAANFSVGVNVLLRLAANATTAMPNADVEIFEAHHKHKVDAPSGTALAIGGVVAKQRHVDLVDAAAWGRHGSEGPRRRSEIGFQVARGGSVVGTHTLFLFDEGEQIELTHRATDRSVFARGAIRAAGWVVAQPAGLYDMQNVLFD